MMMMTVTVNNGKKSKNVILKVIANKLKNKAPPSECYCNEVNSKKMNEVESLNSHAKTVATPAQMLLVSKRHNYSRRRQSRE